MRISDWSSDVCSSDLKARKGGSRRGQGNIAQSARALSHFEQRGAHFGQGMGNGAMIAVKRLQSIFWVYLVTLGVVAVYFVSLRVEREWPELARGDGQIREEGGRVGKEWGRRCSVRCPRY